MMKSGRIGRRCEDAQPTKQSSSFVQSYIRMNIMDRWIKSGDDRGGRAAIEDMNKSLNRFRTRQRCSKLSI
jgi:hypothetical protein